MLTDLALICALNQPFGGNDMPFYEYRQNNSGGSFDYSESAGISCYVYVEADSQTEANRLAEEIGLYFNGCSSGRDCSCCGDRWDAPWRDKGTETPSYYGSQPITPDTKLEEVTQYGGWMTQKGRPEGFIHYRDGRIVPTLH